MSQVILYRATDGALFETEAELRVYQAQVTNKAKIEDFVNRHYPQFPLEPAFNADGTPELNKKGEQVMKRKQNQYRGAVRKALAQWIAENTETAED